MTQSDPARLLGAFLRAHREKLTPPAKIAGRRRTPGWRREELADAAGVSTTWLTWLEQGRPVTASGATLARLAEALQLSVAERASLFDLAGKRDPAGPPDFTPELPAHLLAIPDLFQVPAYLLDHGWTARAWNPAAARLFVGWLDGASDERNLLKFTLLAPEARRLIADWEERATRLVAEFRADYSRRPRDSQLQALVDELSVASPLFARCWQAQAVLLRDGGERDFNHPQQGQCRYRQTTLAVAALPECKIVCLAPLSSAED